MYPLNWQCTSTVKLSRSLSDVQEEESDGDDILNVLLKGSKLTNFCQMRIFQLMFYVTVHKSRGQTHDRFAEISRAIVLRTLSWRTVFTHFSVENFQPPYASIDPIFRYFYNFEHIQKIYVKKTRKQKQKFSSYQHFKKKQSDAILEVQLLGGTGTSSVESPYNFKALVYRKSFVFQII